MTPSVSCIIPTHDRLEHLLNAISSVMNQTALPLEIIVVDDQDSARVSKAVFNINQYSRVPIVYLGTRSTPSASGACSSRNKGAHAARGDYVSFLDDDDIWLPEFCETLMSAIKRDCVDLAVSAINRRRPDGRLHLFTTPRSLNSVDILNHRVGMTGSNFMVRRSLYLDVGGFDENVFVFNDWDLFIRFVDFGAKYSVVDDILAEWIDHGGERISKPNSRRADGIDFFVARYRGRMAGSIENELVRVALGLRWRHGNTRSKLAAVAKLMAIRVQQLLERRNDR